MYILKEMYFYVIIMTKCGVFMEEVKERELFIYGKSALSVLFRILKANQNMGFFTKKNFIVRTENHTENMRIENNTKDIVQSIWRLHCSERKQKKEKIRKEEEKKTLDKIEKNKLIIYDVSYERKSDKIIITISENHIFPFFIRDYDFNNNEYNRERISEITSIYENNMNDEYIKLIINSDKSLKKVILFGWLSLSLTILLELYPIFIAYVGFAIYSYSKCKNLVKRFNKSYFSPNDIINKIIEESEEKEKSSIVAKDISYSKPKLGPPGEIKFEPTKSNNEKVKGKK